MEEQLNIVKKTHGWNKKTKIIVSILIVVIFIGIIYFLIPVIKKYNQQRIDKEIEKRNIVEGEWLKTQVVPMTEEEKIEIGKKMLEESKNTEPLTQEQQQDILDFINS